MKVYLNHVNKETRIILQEHETAAIRKFFEEKVHMEWPEDTDDTSAVEDALREIIDENIDF